MKFFAAAALLGYVSAKITYINHDAPNSLPLPKDFKPNVRKPLTPANDIPATFVWNNVNGTNFLTNVRN